jgi:hypothetical protein
MLARELEPRILAAGFRIELSQDGKKVGDQ